MSEWKQDQTNLPVPRSWVMHVLFWCVTFIFYFAPYLFTEQAEEVISSVRFDHRALRLLLRLSSVMAASYFITWRILPAFLERKKVLLPIIELLIGIYVICVLSRISVIYMLEPLQHVGRHQETLLEIFTQVRVLFLYYFIGIFTGTFPFLFMHQLIERQKMQHRQMVIESEKKTAELAALKSQLNPHFLFNTLNNMYSLAVQQSPLAAVSIEKLSKILDYLLYQCNETYVPLDQEIALLNNYIALEKLRYSSRLHIETNFQSDSNYLISPLILLSIVENMFKHGVEKTTGEAILKIELNATKGKFSIATENTFDSSGKTEQGIGLKNVQQQLHLLYPNRHSLKMGEKGHVFVTQLEIIL